MTFVCQQNIKGIKSKNRLVFWVKVCTDSYVTMEWAMFSRYLQDILRNFIEYFLVYYFKNQNENVVIEIEVVWELYEIHQPRLYGIHKIN
jgi:hypothetical protein